MWPFPLSVCLHRAAGNTVTSGAEGVGHRAGGLEMRALCTCSALLRTIPAKMLPLPGSPCLLKKKKKEITETVFDL